MRKIPHYTNNKDLKVGDKIKLPKEYLQWLEERTGYAREPLKEIEKSIMTVSYIDKCIWDTYTWISVKEETGKRYLKEYVEKVN